MPTSLPRTHRDALKSLNQFLFPPGWGQEWVHLCRVFAWHCCGISHIPLLCVGGQAWNLDKFDHFIPSPACRNHCQSWKLLGLLQGSLALGWLQPCSGAALFPLGWSRVFSSSRNTQHVALMGKRTPRWMKLFHREEPSSCGKPKDQGGRHQDPVGLMAAVVATKSLELRGFCRASTEVPLLRDRLFFLPAGTGSLNWAPLPHVRASHECRCCSATKNGDTGYKNTTSGGEGDVFLLVGHLQEAPHRRGWPRRPNGASPSGEAWLKDSPEERAEHPRNLPGWIWARLLQSAA